MNNPYFYRPQPSSLRAADALFQTIQSHPDWLRLFSQGKMLGVLVYSREPFKYICAYSGVVNGLSDPEHFFVPPIYDLQSPDDFYLRKDAEITDINHRIDELEQAGEDTTELRMQRRQLSTALQLEIFSYFNFIAPDGTNYKNIVQIFSDARRGLPPGGAGECAAPRLLQYARLHHLPVLEIAECWFGASPRATLRVHGQFYPSCIEKCSPILNYMTQGIDCERAPEAEPPLPLRTLQIVYEDEYLLLVNKPAGALSVPGKVAGDSVEQRLHELYPHVKGPMLVHRLDQSTSGLLLAAKDALTHKVLQQNFETRAIHKQYLAVIDGELPSSQGLISLPICPNPDDRPRQTVEPQFGKPAITAYRVIERHFCTKVKTYAPVTTNASSSSASPSVSPSNSPSATPSATELTAIRRLLSRAPSATPSAIPSATPSASPSADTQSVSHPATLLQLSPLSGRTHQLRLHLASHLGLGHPIMGDRLYGGSTYERLMLHAWAITFTHPATGQSMHFEVSPEW